MGYGFVKFDSSENASKAIHQGRVAFDDTAHVEIKATAKRNVNDNRNNQSLSEKGSKEYSEAQGGAALGVAAAARGVAQGDGPRSAVAEVAATRRTTNGDEMPPPVKPHAQPCLKSMAARLTALEAAASQAGLVLPASRTLVATAAAAAAKAAAGIPSGGAGTRSQHRWARLAARVAALGRRWPFDFVLATVNYVVACCGPDGRDLRALLHSRRAAPTRSRPRCPARFRGTSWRICGIGSCGSSCKGSRGRCSA